ncbi:hypothetical protein HU200_011976 [Digitaria exilis]|uniref:Myb/SANT-like DNA-binding domain-containing protein n=1 Tax=Digitaria exilis TaxID=1010633 RepID=A0A835FG98_9POAL|nr:hypothetical protein HU200_011976 [Digitaria exilis]
MERSNNNNLPGRALHQIPAGHGHGHGSPSGLPPRPPQSSQSQLLQAFHRIAYASAAGSSTANQITPQEDDAPPPPAPQPAAASVLQSQPCRAKWNAHMVKLLVSAVSYVEEDMASNQYGVNVRMGKWRLVSTAMTERGFAASPQQCEDKFHDLNKKYKRVTAILGAGTACDIVENPVLLNKLRLPAKLKEEARKHLNSANLYFEQMCSYHNRNRFSLLDDPQLRSALRRIARGGDPDGQEGNMSSSAGFVEESHQMMMPSDDNGDDNDGDEVIADGGDVELLNHDTSGEGHSGSRDLSRVAATDDMNRMFVPEGSSGPAADDENERLIMNAIQTERARLKKMRLKMEQNHLEWMRSIEEKDSELEKMRMDNRLMKMKNDELKLEIKEMEMAIKQKRIK